MIYFADTSSEQECQNVKEEEINRESDISNRSQSEDFPSSESVSLEYNFRRDTSSYKSKKEKKQKQKTNNNEEQLKLDGAVSGGLMR